MLSFYSDRIVFFGLKERLPDLLGLLRVQPMPEHRDLQLVVGPDMKLLSQ
jgi:hypothetical protein